MDTNFYLLGHEAAEERRLVRQAQELAGETRWLFDQLDLPVGARALDLGCGPRGVLDLLSARVGSSGTVVGLDRGEDTLARARAFVAEQGLHNVELIQGDARATGQPHGSFELVHARLVLVNVPRPEEIVREMVALARPGGVVASHEADYLPHRCDPPCAAWERLFELFQAHSRSRRRLVRGQPLPPPAPRGRTDGYPGPAPHLRLSEGSSTPRDLRPLHPERPHGAARSRKDRGQGVGRPDDRARGTSGARRRARDFTHVLPGVGTKAQPCRVTARSQPSRQTHAPDCP